MQKGRLVSLKQADFELWQSEGGAVSKPIDNRLLRLVISERLTPVQRECINKYFFENMTMRQIAEERGVSLPTVSRTVKRAKRRIYEALKYSVRR